MPVVTKHEPGSFCWPELATTDAGGAKTFYKGLFGWDANDSPAGPDMVYTMLEKSGKKVGALYGLGAQQKGVPPHWNIYVAVASADETAKKAKALGGKVLMEPFDVMDVGRMAIIQDQQGATFCIWEAKKHIGAVIMNEPGALCWTELTTTDTKAAEAFYTKLFGWTPKHNAPGAPMEYTEFSVAGTPSISMMAKPADMPAHIPSYWMPYFQVAGVDASAAKAKELGGKIMVGPQDIPGTGRFAIATDPQGAMFALFEFKQG